MKQQLQIKISSDNANHEFLRIVKAVAKIQKVELEVQCQKVQILKDSKRRSAKLKSYKKALDSLNFQNLI